MTKPGPASVADLRLEDHLCFALYSASMAVTRLYKPMLDEIGLTYPQFLVLKALDEAGTLTVGALAQRLSLDPSTITPLVKRLEAAEFVKRARVASDERKVEVTLSPGGQRAVVECVCLGEALMTQSAMTEADLAGLTSRLKTLRERLAAG